MFGKYAARSVKANSSTGFTLLEVLLSIAVITIIAGTAIPVYESFQVRNDLDIAATTFVQSLRRAQVLAEASDGDTSSGVRIDPGSITLFRGTSFASRNSSFDEIFQIPSTISIAGNAEVVFGRFTGLPTTVGSTTLTSITNETRTIVTNAKGTISY